MKKVEGLHLASGSSRCACGAQIEPVIVEGYPDFYPRFCSVCAQRSEAETRTCADTERLQEMGLCGRWLSATFENLQEPKPKQAVLEACRVFTRTCTNGGSRGLYLWSETNGTGKSHLAAAITRQQERGLFCNMGDLLNALRLSFTMSSRCELYERALSTPFLVLDDLGAHPMYDWVEEKLYTLINNRWLANQATVITSNLSPRTLQERLSSRVASRVMGFCDIVKVEGPDHRLRSCRVIV